MPFEIPILVGKEVEEKYKTGDWSIRKIAREVGFSAGIITKYLLQHKYNTTLYLDKHGTGPKVKYYSNLRLIEENSPERDYWIGFIMTDGNVCKNILAVKLAEKDGLHLEKLSKFLEYDGKLFFCKEENGYDGNSVKLYVNNKILVSGLYKYGIVPRKSLCAEFKNINYKNSPALWRGAIDGDGCVYIYRKIKKYGINLCGTKRICEQFKEFLDYNNITPQSILQVKKHKNQYRITVGAKKEIVKLIHLLYDNSTVCLDRKYEKAQEILNEFKKIEEYVMSRRNKNG